MKKLILIAFTAIAATQANAQFSINPEAGVNFANINGSIGGTKQTTKSITGYKVGAVLDIGITHGFYIQPGAFYSVKGYSVASPISGDDQFKIGYIEVPLNLAYRYDFGNAGAVFAAAGPYVGIAMKGTGSVNYPILGRVEGDMKFGNDPGELKKIDYGVNFSLGYISPIGIYLRAQYGLGLANLNNVNNTSVKNRVFGVSVGYAFQLNER
jgi:hypothetical protein